MHPPLHLNAQLAAKCPIQLRQWMKEAFIHNIIRRLLCRLCQVSRSCVTRLKQSVLCAWHTHILSIHPFCLTLGQMLIIHYLKYTPRQRRTSGFKQAQLHPSRWGVPIQRWLSVNLHKTTSVDWPMQRNQGTISNIRTQKENLASKILAEV